MIEDKFKLIKKEGNVTIYRNGEWDLAIRKYGKDDNDPYSFYALLDSGFTRKVTVIFYPDQKKYFYDIKGGQYSQEGVNEFLSLINECCVVVEQAKQILADEYNITFEQ